MESLGTAVLELVADVKPLVAGLEKGKAVSEEMAASTASGFRGGITKAAIPAAAAVGALVIGLHKSLDAAEENQVSQAKLAQAFETAGLDISDYTDEIDKTEQASAQLGFKSEDVKAALAQLVVATHNAKEATNLLATAQDLARYKGISLTDASKMLTSTMSGSTRAARQLGITFVPVTAATDALKAKTQYATLAEYEHAKSTAYLEDKQASAAKMVGLLNDKLGGQAQAFASTAQGAKEKMGAEFQLLEINIGNVLIPVLTRLSAVLATASEWLTKHAVVAKILIAVVGSLALAVLAVNAATKVWNALTSIQTAGSKLLKLALGEQTVATEAQTAATDGATVAQEDLNVALLANPIGAVIVALVALGVAFAILWNKSKTFRDIVTGTWKDIKTAAVDVFDWVKGHWPLILGILTGPIGTAVALIATHWRTIKSDLVHAWGDIKDAAKSAAGAVVNAFEDMGKGIANGFISAINELIGLLDAIHFTIGKVSVLGHTLFGGLDWHPFNIPKIPMLAEGGIVTSPTLAMIGEAGPEAVIPLEKGGLGSSATVTVNVTGWVGSDQDLATKIGRTLEQLNRRGTKFALA